MNLQVGQSAHRSLTFMAEHVHGYAELTGDRNPLHFDEEFAAATKFGKLVVQGGPRSWRLIGRGPGRPVPRSKVEGRKPNQQERKPESK